MPNCIDDRRAQWLMMPYFDSVIDVRLAEVSPAGADSMLPVTSASQNGGALAPIRRAVVRLLSVANGSLALQSAETYLFRPSSGWKPLCFDRRS
jgi:hypothetical protein